MSNSSATPPPRLVFNIEETSLVLRVAPRTVRNLVQRGQLRAIRIGRRRLVTADAVAAFLRERESEALA